MIDSAPRMLGRQAWLEGRGGKGDEGGRQKAAGVLLGGA